MTDIETERLREAVVEAAKRWSMCSSNIEDAQLLYALKDLEEHEDAKAAPEPAPRCEPPKETDFYKWHWLTYRPDLGLDHYLELWHWDGNHWSSYGLAEGRDRISQAKEGWSYHSRAIPDSRVMPTDEAIASWHSQFPRDGMISRMDAETFGLLVRATLAHFTAPARVEPTTRAIMEIAENLDMVHQTEPGGRYYAKPVSVQDIISLARVSADLFSPTQPAPVQQITDEEIIATAYIYGRNKMSSTCPGAIDTLFSPDQLLRFARTLLAEHSPDLSKDLLLQLRDIALTRDGEDLYLTDARMRLGVGK